MRVRSRAVERARSARAKCARASRFVRQEPWLWSTPDLREPVAAVLPRPARGPPPLRRAQRPRRRCGRLRAGARGGRRRRGRDVARPRAARRAAPLPDVHVRHVERRDAAVRRVRRSGPRSGSSCIVGAVEGACMAAGMVVWGTLMSTRVPAELRGRVHSFDWFVSIGLTPISFALTGPFEGDRHRRDAASWPRSAPAVATVVLYSSPAAPRRGALPDADQAVPPRAEPPGGRPPRLRRDVHRGTRRRRSRRPRAGRASRARAGRAPGPRGGGARCASSATVSRSASSTIRRTSSSMICCVCSETSEVAGQQHALAAAVDGDRADDVAHPPARDHAARDVRELLEVGLGAGRRLAVDDALGRAAAERDLDLRESS